MTHPSVPDAPAEGGSAEPGLRDRLRRETRAEHEALDALFARLFQPGADALYATFLRMNRDAHRALDPLLPAEVAPAGDARRLAAERDCAELGLPDEAPPAAAAALLPARPSRFEAFGMAYVLEGSRLGARFMMKAAGREADAADARHRLPTRYLQASGDTRPFADLLRAMEAAAPSAREGDEAVRAAQATFRYFRALATGRGIEETAQA